MKYFSEEKKMKTFPLLLSSPLTSWQLVLAKTLLGATVLFILLTLSSILPLSLIFFGDLPLGLFVLSYFGTFMVLMCYITAGILASALTDSLIVSVVLAVVFNVGLLLMGIGREMVSSPLMKDFFHYLSLDYHFSFFRSGSFSIASILFLVSIWLFFSFLSERVIEFHRWK